MGHECNTVNIVCDLTVPNKLQYELYEIVGNMITGITVKVWFFIAFVMNEVDIHIEALTTLQRTSHLVLPVTHQNHSRAFPKCSLSLQW